MKQVWLFFCAVFCLISCGPKTSFEFAGTPLWEKTYDETPVWVNNIAIAPDGEAFLFGVLKDDLRLLRVDEDGNKLWEKTHPVPGESWFPNLAMAPDGTSFVSINIRPSEGAQSNMYLMRLDETGNKLWEKTYSGLRLGGLGNLTLMADGGALLIGAKQPSANRHSDSLLIRVDKDGTKLWAKSYGGYENFTLISLVSMADGGSLVVGSYSERQTGADGSSETYHVYLMRVDENGEKLWEKTYPGPKHTAISNVALTPNGGALLGGLLQFETGGHWGRGQTDMYLMRVDRDGKKLWENNYGGDENNLLYSLVLTPDGGALLGGDKKFVVGELGQVRSDMYLVQVDKNGNKVFERTYDNAGNINLGLTPDGKVFLTGTAKAPSTPPKDTEPHGEIKCCNMYLMRLE